MFTFSDIAIYWFVMYVFNTMCPTMLGHIVELVLIVIMLTIMFRAFWKSDVLKAIIRDIKRVCGKGTSYENLN